MIVFEWLFYMTIFNFCSQRAAQWIAPTTAVIWGLAVFQFSYFSNKMSIVLLSVLRRSTNYNLRMPRAPTSLRRIFVTHRRAIPECQPQSADLSLSHQVSHIALSQQQRTQWVRPRKNRAKVILNLG